MSDELTYIEMDSATLGGEEFKEQFAMLMAQAHDALYDDDTMVSNSSISVTILVEHKITRNTETGAFDVGTFCKLKTPGFKGTWRSLRSVGGKIYGQSQEPQKDLFTGPRAVKNEEE